MVLTAIDILVALWVLSVVNQTGDYSARLVRVPSDHGRRSA